MAEKKAVGHAYNIDFLNVVFAASSIFLFVSTIWMVWDDFDREWKNTQRRFTQLELEVTNAQLAQTQKSPERAKLPALQQQLAAAEKAMEANRQRIDEINGQLSDVDARLYRVNKSAQFAKATYDVNRYAFEAARTANPEGVGERQKEIEAEAQRLNELNLEVQKVEAERAALQAELGKFTSEVGRLQKELTQINFEQTRLQRVVANIEPSLVKDYFRNAPLLDFMAPTLTVRQVVTPNVVDDVNFARVAKMDRCTTCHLAIDRRGYEKYPQPFRTHPNLQAYVGSDSPHPLATTGCTVCHQGLGGSTGFNDASHYPSNPKQREEWEEKYHWHEPHMWDYPMLPTNMTEASCQQCHRQEVYVPQAPRLNVAYATYERAGCYACHKTKGFENLRKPGPILTKISGKLTQDWVKNWVRDPYAIKNVTWMPKVWYNSNTNSPADHPRNEAEINAAVAYLFANSETYTPAVASPPRGNPKAGEQIVRSIGCLGCHIVDENDRAAAGPRRTFGQPLKSVGSKTTYTWLYNWVRDPKHYNPATYMPDLRLTDAQVADVATYLTTLTGSAGTAAPVTPTQAQVDAVLLDYLRNLMPLAEAQGRLAKMDTTAKQLDLGQRVIARYGCFSCHDIKGFETTQPIGVDLSEEGSKLVTRLDFAFVDIPHSKLEWFHQKLKDPRSFDQGRVLEPLEKLRMPDFRFNAVENERLQTAIMSFQREVQPASALPPRTAMRDFTVNGRALVRRQNCVGCHEIEGDGGDYKTLVADASLAPPLLTPEGAKVQPDWLYAFLQGPITIRPWLDVRMPTFGLDDRRWNGIINYFQATGRSTEQFRTYDHQQLTQMAAPGRELFELLQCQKCHVLGAIRPDQDRASLAPDLRMAHERLKPEWVLDWLRNPSRIQPGTRMPQFWPTPPYPKSSFPQLGGDADTQIRAIRDYLYTFRGGPSPRRGAGAAQSTN
ncbi:MAG TPA: c-type cytochrome [Vicinamibacterales bacterium]|nr:c-type cytochrome [Vicinamibacterales bacterium]